LKTTVSWLCPRCWIPTCVSASPCWGRSKAGSASKWAPATAPCHWLADQVGPSGHVTATDIDTTFLDRLSRPNLEVRQLDVTKDPIREGYDLVCARALLHHIPERLDVTKRLAAAVKPGGFILLEEPDFHSVLATDSPAVRNFWSGFIAWAANCGIDYYIGRRIAPALDQAGMTEIDVHGETIMFQGGSA